MPAAFSQYAFLAPLFPLAAFAALTALSRHLKRAGPAVAIAASLASLVLSLLIVFGRLGGDAEDYSAGFRWLTVGEASLRAGFEVTNLTSLMLAVVSFVSVLVLIYSLGYMRDDERKNLFFAYVSLFAASMLGLVLADNLLLLYIGWELVGVSSFLLIGFWYRKPEAAAAAKKAFIVTRVGDLGLLIAILLLFRYMPGHALDFVTLHNVFDSQAGVVSQELATVVALLLFLGAAGKSGQFPLHIWLPDAMEGPTPVSALIHAATMVAAGVFLVARTYDIFEASAFAMNAVAYIGALTAGLAAAIALKQHDIKRVLAYSTVSQLGYMMLALGSGSWTAAIFHLFTHAFFKALLFLGAGNVIRALHTRDLRRMGGIGGRMKTTAWTFGIGALALTGIPPLAGFWSKDAVLAAAADRHPLLFAAAAGTVFLTACYMARLFFLAFAGKFRGNAEIFVRAKEAPAVMTVPLLVLAVPAAVAGFAQSPFGGGLESWLSGEETGHGHGLWIMAVSAAAAALGLFLGWMVYGKGSLNKDGIERTFAWPIRLAERKFYVDEALGFLFAKPLQGLGRALRLFDEAVVDGAGRLAASSVQALGRLHSRLLNGQMQVYALAAVIAVVVLALAIAGRRFW
ncbi:NADH-quinone oxidoreductase subunit L [Cohnella algarum]|uniref:NADH-quinone oxidoreductase subunit L n=1 Tax=Cohnella algarum TaxID=2044859 RepID=UPI0019674647|nr:NADH-quinone oxidoreductase subunit L [Cohnella algarum]MBN2980712.1 NADH-quinone oxidoreductase subunit L [Cohnella algarum]